ncbi:hypothetical protein GCM10020219_038680 [Nonomuraea dietziae]
MSIARIVPWARPLRYEPFPTLRRLLVIGLLHMFLIWPGDVLAIYAASGLVFLLPSTWLPHRSRSGAAAPCQAAIHH